MRKRIYIIVTVFIMLIASRFLIRIVDATVQIDSDIGLLVVLLAIINAVIVGLSRFIYKRSNN